MVLQVKEPELGLSPPQGAAAAGPRAPGLPRTSLALHRARLSEPASKQQPWPAYPGASPRAGLSFLLYQEAGGGGGSFNYLHAGARPPTGAEREKRPPGAQVSGRLGEPTAGGKVTGLLRLCRCRSPPGPPPLVPPARLPGPPGGWAERSAIQGSRPV